MHDAGSYPYQVFRVHRAWGRTVLVFKVVGGILLAAFTLIAFIVHESERMNRHRCRH